MLDGQPFEFSNYLGGLTDDFHTKDRTQYTKADNILFNVTGQPVSAPGSIVWGSGNQGLKGNPVSILLNYQDDTNLLAIRNQSLFYWDGADWSQILTPNNGVVFPTSASDRDMASSAQWRDHLFISREGRDLPVKVFKDSANAFKCMNAGLPQFPNNISTTQKATLLASAITLVNDIKSKFSTHIANTTGHAAAQSYSFAANASDEPTLITLTVDLLNAYRAHIDDARTKSPTYHNKSHKETVFGHFYAQELPLPISLLTCIPVLTNLKLVVNLHMESLNMSPTGGDNLDNYFHPYTPVLVSAADVTITALPVVSDSAQLTANPLYTYIDELSDALQRHYAKTAGNGAHGTADISAVYTRPTTSTSYLLIKLYYKVLLSFYNHRTQDGTIHGSTEPNSTLPSAASLFPFGLLKLTSYTIANVVDPSTVAGVQEIWDNLADIGAKATLHVPLGVGLGVNERHNNTAGTFGELINFGTAYVGFHQFVIQSTVRSYQYALSYRNTYKVYGGKEFIDEGAPYVFTSGPVARYSNFDTTLGVFFLTSPVNIDGPLLSLTSLPVLAASGGYNASTTQKVLYRSIANGTQLFENQIIANSATSHADTASDAFLTTQPLIYTDGGAPANDPPPLAKYLHITNGYGYYASITDQYGVTQKNRILQSIQDDPDSCPESFFVDLPNEVVGISSVRSNVIAWTAHKTYRLEGAFNEDGSGSITATAISDSVGLAASYSPVPIDNGLLFFGTDGIYFTDGYSLKKINTSWKTSYLALIASGKAPYIQGTYDWKNKRVWWAVTKTSTTYDRDNALVLDLNFPLTENSVFTTLSGGSVAGNYKPYSFCFFNNQVLWGDANGYVFIQDPAYLSTPTVNTSVTASNFTTATVIYDFRSPCYDFGTISSRKWHTRTTVKAKYHTNLSLQVNLITDDGARTGALTPIRYRGTSQIEEKRLTPAGHYRCMTRQVQLTNAKVVITNSDTLGQATLDHTAKTLTLLAGSWPTDPTLHVVCFPGDNYTAEFTISARSATVLTLVDAGGLLPVTGTTKWEIKGYPKDEQFELISYCLYVAILGPSQHSASGESGANA